MTATHFSGPLIAGDLLAGQVNGPNQGNVMLVQATGITQNSTAAVSSTMYVPNGSDVVTFYVDVLTAFNSATSAVLSIGATSGGTDYASGVDVKTAAGRITITFTAAQLAAIAGVSLTGVVVASTPIPIVVTVTPTGATSAGYVRVTMLYVQY